MTNDIHANFGHERRLSVLNQLIYAVSTLATQDSCWPPLFTAGKNAHTETKSINYESNVLRLY